MRKRHLTAAALLTVGWAGAQAPGSCGGTNEWPEWLPRATQGAALFRGMIGGLPVALRLAPQDDTRYFYERRGIDLDLTARRSGQTLILEETVRKTRASEPVVTGCFRLSPTAAGLKGTWQAPGKAPLAVTLNRVDPEKLPLALGVSPGLLSLRTGDPMAFLKVNRPWVKAADGRSVREPASGVVYPRVPGGSAALNAALQDRQLDHAVSTLDCRAMLPQDLQNDPQAGYEVRTQLTFQKGQLLSLRDDVYYDCGGAHPDSFTEGAILDRTTGKAVALQALWPRLTPARQKELYLKAVQSGMDRECLNVLREEAPSFTAHLSPAGLNLTPSGLPHVVAACAETGVIPFATLRAEANSASKYFNSVYGR
ncbi:hypothetical protein [Deinococcus arcticus]|uniref:hypothetical protein n=1 Tax=Deinococcus arcticus TaxID=2136176 RepID=UPI001E3B3B9F|nr:hypothetical protein [Deinococcus arcticus]